MAVVRVTTWLDYESEGVTYIGLRNAINNATEATDIYLDANIDLNEESPQGVEPIAVSSAVDGNITVISGGNKIKNLKANGIRVFSGYSSTKKLIIQNVIFEDAYIINDSIFAKTYCDFQECSITIDMVDSALADESKATFTGCGLTLTGYGNARIMNSQTSADPSPFTHCNIELNGTFSSVIMNLQDSYLSGDFKKTGDSYLSFRNSYLSVINATIESSTNLLATSAKFLLVNTDGLTLPEGSSLPSTVIPCTTSQLESVSDLRSLGAPIREG